MAAGLLGQKLEMTQIYDNEGQVIPVTVVKAGPCVVVQIKTGSKDGYNAVQLGFKVLKESKFNRPSKGHFSKNKIKPHRYLREFRLNKTENYQIGQSIEVSTFRAGDVVNVSGHAKGNGFQGVIKRHGKHGGPASHGSRFHRTTGSIGQRTSPGEVFKNMKLPGHMGTQRVTVRNLEIIAVKNEDHLIYLKGSVPGAKNGFLVIESCDPDFESRISKSEVSEDKKIEAKEGEPKKILTEPK